MYRRFGNLFSLTAFMWFALFATSTVHADPEWRSSIGDQAETLLKRIDECVEKKSFEAAAVFWKKAIESNIESEDKATVSEWCTTMFFQNHGILKGLLDRSDETPEPELVEELYRGLAELEMRVKDELVEDAVAARKSIRKRIEDYGTPPSLATSSQSASSPNDLAKSNRDLFLHNLGVAEDTTAGFTRRRIAHAAAQRILGLRESQITESDAESIADLERDEKRFSKVTHELRTISRREQLAFELEEELKQLTRFVSIMSNEEEEYPSRKNAFNSAVNARDRVMVLLPQVNEEGNPWKLTDLFNSKILRFEYKHKLYEKEIADAHIKLSKCSDFTEANTVFSYFFDVFCLKSDFLTGYYVLQRMGEESPLVDRALLYSAVSQMAFYLGNLEEARSLASLAVAKARRLDIPSLQKLDLFELARRNDITSEPYGGFMKAKCACMAFETRAMIRRADGDYDGAIEDFVDAARRGASINYQLAQVADAFAVKGDMENAIKHASLAIDRFAAIEYSSKCSSCKPVFVACYLLRGKCRSDMGDFVGAIADATKTLELQPQSAEALSLLQTAKSKLNLSSLKN